MLILDVGKIKYNKKFYKSIIYTTLVLNIISFGIFPKSQSKFKEESKEPVVVYSTALYTKRDWVEEKKTDTIEAQMNLIEDEDKYTSTMKSAYFEYSITSSDYTLHYEDIKDTMEISWETTNPVNGQLHSGGTCNVIKYQKSDDDKGILLCRALQDDNEYFGKYGITLKISATDTDVKLDYNAYKKVITDLTIEGEEIVKAGDYQTFVKDNQKSNPTKLILDSPTSTNGCDMFNEWLRYYSVDYYPSLANATHQELTGIIKSDLEFTYHSSVVPYIEKYGYTNSSSCNLTQLDIPGLNYEVVEIPVENPDTILQRHIYTIEDNFLGYARTDTKGISANPKEMYFSTKDGESFLQETDSEKWQKMFNEYAGKLYSTSDATELINYITNKGGILQLLQQTTLNEAVGNYSNILGFEYYLSSNKIIIDLSIIDDIYNENHKGENKLRVTKRNTGDTADDKVKMWNSFKRNILVMYGGVYDVETIESLYKTANNPNRTQMLAIYQAIINADDTDIYVDGIQGLGTDTGKTFTAHIYGDGTYKWFEILPAGTRIDENTTSYTLRPNSTSVYSLNRTDSILKQIQMLDAYYKVDKHTEINEDVVYLYNANKELIGYVQIEINYDSNYVVKEVIYTAYIGEFDTEVIKPPIDSDIINDSSSDIVNDTDTIIENPSVDLESPKTEEVEDSVSADLDLSGEDEKGNEQTDEVQEDNSTIEETANKEEFVKNEEDMLKNDNSESTNADIPLKNESDAPSADDLSDDDKETTPSVEMTPDNDSGVQDLGNEDVSNTSINDSIESINEVQTEILLESIQ